ncbi:MAG: hypothetical protein AAFS10_27330, partial [Myxococcota bacterium]
MTPYLSLFKLALIAIVGLASACSDDSDTTTADTSQDTGNPDDTPDTDPSDAPLSDTTAEDDISTEDVPIQPPPCDESLRPLVAAHGFLASGDTYANHAMRFAANGSCLDRLRPFDWNTLDQNANAEEGLDQFIDDLLAESGAEQVDLAGHSAGGGLGYRYLADPERASKVAHYIHIGSNTFEGPAGPEQNPVPTLNLWSQDDLIIEDKGDIPGATNVQLPGADHYAVATNAASFEAIYRFVSDDQEPATTAIEPSSDPILVSGRAATFGENTPLAL